MKVEVEVEVKVEVNAMESEKRKVNARVNLAGKRALSYLRCVCTLLRRPLFLDKCYP